MEKEFTRSRQKNPLDTMASGIAHELNNILYPIVIYSNLLLSKAKPGSEEYLDLSEILDCATRAGDLVSKIRIYSGNIESENKVSDLAVIISETMKSIRATNAVTVIFEEQICGDKMPALCDAAQISQVLTNLCTNSVQAIENAGKIQITMEPMNLDGFECLDGAILSGEHARLTVTDNGGGIHEATLTKIFDPFFTTHTGATGLGLSTVIGIVRSHSGGISVSSKPGVGTTIEVLLPLAEGITDVLPD